MEKSKVYFCKEITPENVVKMFKALGRELPGKVAVKVHSGEAGNQNFLRPEFMKPMVEYVNGTIVENNTAYEGERTNTKDHLKVIENHGWNKYFNVDILDSEKPDLELQIPNGKILKQNLSKIVCKKSTVIHRIIAILPLQSAISRKIFQ